MVKNPEFEKPKAFGASSESLPIDPWAIKITEGAEVDLRYKGATVAVSVTKVIHPQSEFEGTVIAFNNSELEHEDLKHGDAVYFTREKIQHIFKWIKEDQ